MYRVYVAWVVVGCEAMSFPFCWLFFDGGNDDKPLSVPSEASAADE